MVKRERAFGTKLGEEFNTPLFMAFVNKHTPEIAKTYLHNMTVGDPLSFLVAALENYFQDNMKDGKKYLGNSLYDYLIEVIRREAGLLFQVRTDGLNDWLVLVDKPVWNLVGAEKKLLADHTGSITARSIEDGVRNVLGLYLAELGIDPYEPGKFHYVSVLIED